ncbi:probable pectinesterase/pectinesterase inhibitor 46 [Corylus avellana]|uniref:probable pectinesterase/pectinesterase inhibitor 46 n=1 Tax=Corylus avellana TaxID=13451 RepID=UPI00286A1769|nr:probable pectinesterase/pectinesterase inhibitor 46 [Corylus avellana]
MFSFKGYGKVDEAEQAKLEARRKTQKRITIIALCSIILVGVMVAAAVGTRRGNSSAKSGGADQLIATSMKAVCDITLYPETCYSSLGSLANSTQIEPVVVFKLAIQAAMTEVSNAAKRLSESGALGSAAANNMTTIALENCQELLSLAMDHLNDTLLAGSVSLLQVMDDLKTWLSSAATYQETCIDGFENANGTMSLKAAIANHLKNSTETTSNGLAITTWISGVLGSLKLRRLMSFSDEHDGEPKWLHSKDRKLLQNPDLRTMARIVVAQDGSSTYKTITAALQAVPDKSDQRFVIYVKSGVYNENVEVGKNKWNVVMVGDGMTSTVVSGSLNFVDGTPTFKSATFAVYGQGFVAQDMGFRNTAGAIKHQAVALMSNSDKSIFYRCHFDAFQDTLYAHTNRQFYRDCNIYGTVDFIFGNSAVVLQSCNIFPKLPMPGQKNTITAQGKTDPNQNTGISIHDCTILPYGNLTSVKTYLGRPWKDFSTTMILCSNLGSLIDPTGWLPWVGTSAPSTIFYAEYGNYGAGAFTKYRVKWTGLKSIDSTIAGRFTVGSFINGNNWIPASGVPFKLGL